MALRIDKALSWPKRPIEEFRIAWDFTNDLEVGDSANAFEVKAFDAADESDVSATFLQGASRTGNVVSVQVQGGTDAHAYLVRFQLGTTAGDLFQRVVRVGVNA